MKILVVVKTLKCHQSKPSRRDTCVNSASKSSDAESATTIVTSGTNTNSGAR